MNHAAYIFGSLLVLGALVFLWEGVVQDRLHFKLSASGSCWTAMVLMVCGLVIYPQLAPRLGKLPVWEGPGVKIKDTASNGYASSNGNSK